MLGGVHRLELVRPAVTASRDYSAPTTAMASSNARAPPPLFGRYGSTTFGALVALRTARGLEAASQKGTTSASPSASVSVSARPCPQPYRHRHPRPRPRQHPYPVRVRAGIHVRVRVRVPSASSSPPRREPNDTPSQAHRGTSGRERARGARHGHPHRRRLRGGSTGNRVDRPVCKRRSLSHRRRSGRGWSRTLVPARR